MIKIILGNLGGGKTLSEIALIANDESGRITYTNIETFNLKNTKLIRPQDVIKKTEDEKKKTSYELNIEYWQKQKKPLNILWDEIHLTANARTSLAKANIILSRFISMGRRICGFDERGYGHLTFIAQADRTIDINIRELASQINYNVSHWVMACEKCGVKMPRNSEQAQIETCLRCGTWKIKRVGLVIETYYFKSWMDYFSWKVGYGKTYYDRKFHRNMEKYFKYYDTMQLKNIWEDYIGS